MAVVSTRIAPLNSLISVTDAGKKGEPPEYVRDAHILWTTSVVTMGCLMSDDGETLVTMGHAEDLEVRGNLIFDQIMETPTREVIVMQISWEPELSLKVPYTRTRVRIWENRPQEPDDIRIALG